VLTRSQIIEAVWDFAYDGGSNVVDQYVNYLRRKIDGPFGRHEPFREHLLSRGRRGREPLMAVAAQIADHPAAYEFEPGAART
jgi:two-component system OmpR family response regulator